MTIFYYLFHGSCLSVGYECAPIVRLSKKKKKKSALEMNFPILSILCYSFETPFTSVFAMQLKYTMNDGSAIIDSSRGSLLSQISTFFCFFFPFFLHFMHSNWIWSLGRSVWSNDINKLIRKWKTCKSSPSRTHHHHNVIILVIGPFLAHTIVMDVNGSTDSCMKNERLLTQLSC